MVAPEIVEEEEIAPNTLLAISHDEDIEFWIALLKSVKWHRCLIGERIVTQDQKYIWEFYCRINLKLSQERQGFIKIFL